MSAPRAVVCYDEARPGMYLRIEGQDIASFMASAAWRAWLYYPASAVDGTDRDRILLDGGMGLRECQDMLEAIMEDKIDTTFLISHRMPLEQGPEGYRMFHDQQNEVTKIVLKPGMMAAA